MTIDFTSTRNKFYNQKIIPLKEWRTEWKVTPNQRNHEQRSKEEKHQKRFKKLHPDHLEVNGVILSQDCIDPVTGVFYKKGTKFKINGHTRDKCWELGICLDGQPTDIRVKWRLVDSIDEVRREFNIFDSAEPSEKVNDRMYGAYRNAFSHQGKYITHPYLYKVGGIAFAYAVCQPENWVRADKPETEDLIMMAKYLEPALFWLQDIFNDATFSSSKNKVKHTIAMTSLYLSTYMMYKDDDNALERVKQFIIRVSNGRVDFDEPSDACTRFIQEWSTPEKSTFLYGNTGVLSRNRESEWMEGYNLLMMDYYITDNRQGIATRGDEHWRNYYGTWQHKFQDRQNSVNVSDFVDLETTL